MIDLLTAVPSYDITRYKESDADLALSFRVVELLSLSVSGCYSVDASGSVTLVGGNDTCTSTAVWSDKPTLQFESGLNLLKTLFVILVLGIAAIMFTRDAEALVIGPIEHMVEMVDTLANDPSGKKATTDEHKKRACTPCS